MNGIPEQLLDKPEYIHVLINHFPVTGLFVGLIFLILALVFRSRGGILISLAMITLLAASAWPVFYYGEAGHDRVLSMTYSEGEAWLEAHEERAETWIYLFYITGGVSLLGLIMGAFSARSLRYSVPLVIVLTLGSLAAGAYIADAGGKVRHSEFRDGPPPEHGEGEEEEELEPEEDQPLPESPEATQSPESPETVEPAESPEGSESPESPETESSASTGSETEDGGSSSAQPQETGSNGAQETTDER